MTASSLHKVMGMGTESLFNARVGIDVTGHNVANAHTEGYSRQIVETEPRPVATYGNFVFGTGAQVQTIRRAHDAYIEKQLRQEFQNNGHYNALTDGLKDIEDIFSPELSSTIRERADQFVNALREFSNYPEELPVRVSLADTAAQLADSFNVTHANVERVQDNLTSEIRQNLANTNAKLKEVAMLNVEISSAEVGSKNPPNDLLDRRDKLIRELSELMDVNVYTVKGNKVVLRGPGDTLLVDEGLAAQFDFRNLDERGRLPSIHVSDLKSEGWTNINNKFTKGKIAGLVLARDKYAERVRNQVNDFARDFATEFNRVHQMGFGIAEFGNASGRRFFLGVEDTEEPAQHIRVSETVMSSPESISGALTANSPGDNIVANELVRFFSEPKFASGRMSFDNVYEQIIGHIGTDVQQAVDEKDASNIVLAQIQQNKESVSGVSMDEESQNMLKYQNAFNASSKLITTADEMMQTILDLKR